MTAAASGAAATGAGPDQDVHGRGHRMLGRVRGRANRSDTGYTYVYDAVDDRTRPVCGKTPTERGTGGVPRWPHHHDHRRFHTVIGAPPAFHGAHLPCRYTPGGGITLVARPP